MYIYSLKGITRDAVSNIEIKASLWALLKQLILGSLAYYLFGTAILTCIDWVNTILPGKYIYRKCDENISNFCDVSKIVKVKGK